MNINAAGGLAPAVDDWDEQWATGRLLRHLPVTCFMTRCYNACMQLLLMLCYRHRQSRGCIDDNVACSPNRLLSAGHPPVFSVARRCDHGQPASLEDASATAIRLPVETAMGR
jgi:hypothetical protein